MRMVIVRFLLLAAGISLGVTALAATPMPEIKKGRGDTCVEPTDVMRRDHMEFILHQRDETVHRGIRTKKHSLVECIDCHVQKDEQNNFIPVNAEGQFCQTCHTYSSVSMDCFECHATTPTRSSYLHPLVTPRMRALNAFHLRQTIPTNESLLNDPDTFSVLTGDAHE